jgi:hypothetical protein
MISLEPTYKIVTLFWGPSVLRVVGVLLIVVGVTVVICEVWAVDDVVDPGTVSVDDAVGSSIS